MTEKKKKLPAKKRNHGGGKPAHVPTDITRAKVEAMSACGTPQTSIAAIIGIDDKTLRKYYRHELDYALDKANAAIGGKLYQRAMSGDLKAQQFWLRTRAKWSTQHDVNLSGGLVTADVTPPADADKEHTDPMEAARAYKELIKRVTE